jgi:hypothetical protein
VQSGTFTNAPALLGISSGIILSTGNAADAGYAFLAYNLPNTGLGQAGYAPLNALFGPSTHDAAVLTLSFVPTVSPIQFRYVFASAEYPFYQTNFTDPMAIFVNGTAVVNNIALVGTPPVAVTGRTVNSTTNAAYFNKLNGPGDPIIFGGETKVLTAIANVNVGVVNTITFAIADAIDYTLDSALFIEAASVPPPPPPTLTSIAPATGALGTTVPITLTGTNFAEGATVATSNTGITVGPVTVVSATQIGTTLTIAANAATGPANVAVTTSGGTSNELTFWVVPPPPTLTSVSPATGVQGTTVSVTFTGTNFVAPVTVTASNAGIVASNVSVVNAAQITATLTISLPTPPRARGPSP